ncbi:hypothetical protein VS868_12075 [Salinimicrobium sp. 3283s]|uniref:hypothetical protein n=1 Tax=Salinimicrobium sp. 3283s TaxID=3114359 RepID=UPI0031E8C0CB
MKKLLLLFLLTATSCVAQKNSFHVTKVRATVSAIDQGTATIKTNHSGIDYLVEAEDVELQKEYWFRLAKIEESHYRTRRATILEKPVKTCRTSSAEAQDYLAGVAEFDFQKDYHRDEEASVKAVVIMVSANAALLQFGQRKIRIFNARSLETGKEYHFKLWNITILDNGFIWADVIGIPVKSCKTVLAEARDYFKSTNL